MIATLLAELSGHERIEAVHETFAKKSGSEALEFMMWAALFVATIVVLIVLLNRFQGNRRRREGERKAAKPGSEPPLPSSAPPRFVGSSHRDGPRRTARRRPATRRS